MIKFTNAKAMTFNCKGLTHPARAKAIHTWLRDLSINLDFLCLNEVKTSAFLLDSHLKIVNKNFSWITSSHPAGRGGVCLDLNDSMQKALIKSIRRVSWVAAILGPPFNFTVAAVYAPTSSRERSLLWADLQVISGPVILTGDFNMVNSLEDRWNRLGKTISGEEASAWHALAVHLDLIDISTNCGMTWANN